FHAWSAGSDRQTNRRGQHPGAALLRLCRLVPLANDLPEQAAPPGKENPGRLELGLGLVLQQGPCPGFDGPRTCRRSTARSGYCSKCDRRFHRAPKPIDTSLEQGFSEGHERREATVKGRPPRRAAVAQVGTLPERASVGYGAGRLQSAGGRLGLLAA